MDAATRRDWEYGRDINTPPTFADFTTFIETRSSALEILGNSERGGSVQEEKPQQHNTGSYIATKGPLRCTMCSKEHKINVCEKFLEASIDQRRGIVRSKRLCYNCLAGGHPITNCKNRVSCVSCKRRHHSLLHTAEVVAEQNAEGSQKREEVVQSVLFTRDSYQEVLLSTVILKVKNKLGKWVDCRALLDSGAQASFVTQGLVKKLQTPTKRCNTNVLGISGSKQIVKTGAYLSIKSNFNQFSYATNFIVLEKISSDLPHRAWNSVNWKIPPGITLADPKFNKPSAVDMLLGAELFF